MGSKGSKQQGGPDPGGDERRESYKGHEIVIPRDKRRKRIFIDGRPVRYGVVRGEYYLDVYAYDRADSLDEVIRRYVDYQDRTQHDGTKEE